ncbi:VCBS repeat-containing protein, partial [Methylobacterium sp. 174MFSha1.1]|uniref:Ig-like domain-containing protein n=1 Tax=Methylobacterium sp. 174MFSha1.1 TaxID=1502749 RepID=UPI0008DF64DB
SYVYDPNGAFDELAAGQSASDSFSYTVADGAGGRSSATVTIVVAGLNDAPVARPDQTTTPEDRAVVIDVLDNDTDVDAGAVLQLVSASAPPGQGTVAIVDNALVFNPSADFANRGTGQNEVVRVTYTVADEAGLTAEGYVDVIVTADEPLPPPIVPPSVMPPVVTPPEIVPPQPALRIDAPLGVPPIARGPVRILAALVPNRPVDAASPLPGRPDLPDFAIAIPYKPFEPEVYPGGSGIPRGVTENDDQEFSSDPAVTPNPRTAPREAPLPGAPSTSSGSGGPSTSGATEPAGYPAGIGNLPHMPPAPASDPVPDTHAGSAPERASDAPPAREHEATGGLPSGGLSLLAVPLAIRSGLQRPWRRKDDRTVRGTGPLDRVLRPSRPVLPAGVVPQTLPAVLNSIGGVRELVFEAEYDPCALTVVEAAPGPDLPAGSVLGFSTEIADGRARARITVEAASPLASGPCRFALLLCYRAPDTSPRETPLTLSVVSINGGQGAPDAVSIAASGEVPPRARTGESRSGRTGACVDNDACEAVDLPGSASWSPRIVLGELARAHILDSSQRRTAAWQSDFVSYQGFAGVGRNSQTSGIILPPPIKKDT